MSVSQPSESFPLGGKGGSGMRLPLQSPGDQNGNAFRISSSSSSSSSSCLGESSPDSLRSLSSLSGGRTDSPLDYDMFEVTVTTTVTTTADKMADAAISKWLSGEENKEVAVDDDSAGKPHTVTELSESNDNSVSVYLDANSGEYCEDTWNDDNDNDNSTLALSLSASGGSRGTGDDVSNDDLSSGSCFGGRRGSSSLDSDATEVPADDDDDEEEALFLSVSSDLALRRTSMTPTGQPSEGLPIQDGSDATSSSATSTPTPNEASLPEPLVDACAGPDGKNQSPARCSQTSDQRVQSGPESGCNEELSGLGLVRPKGAFPINLSTEDRASDGTATNNGDIADHVIHNMTEPADSDDLHEAALTPFSSSSFSTNPVPDSKESEFESSSLQEVGKCEAGLNPAPPNSTPTPRATKTKTATNSAVTKTTVSTSAKPPNREAKRVPKQDLKNVKAKVASRPAPSMPKTSNQNKSAPANEKRAVPRKQEVPTGNGVKRQRLSTGQAKMTAVLKPIQGRNANLNNRKTNQNTATKDSAQSEKKKRVVANRTLSRSISSLGSEVAEEGPLETPGQDVPVVNGAGGEDTTTEASTKDPDDGSTEEVVNDRREGAKEGASRKTSMTATPRNRGTKVSSKLGPTARQQGKGARGDRGASGASYASGPAPPPGPGTGAPGQGSTGARPAQTDGSTLGKEGQGAGGGCPARARQIQSQSQGIPKPRTTTAERASGLAAPGSVTSNPKPTANQPPGSGPGSGGRPAAPSVSKLPVKGLPTNLSSSSLGSSASEGGGTVATNKAPAPPGGPAPAGGKSEERPSRNTLPAGTQSTAKPSVAPAAGTASASAASSGNASSNVSGAARAPGMRSRALSLQGRTAVTGLKAPAVTSHTAAKTSTANQTAARAAAASNQGSAKQQSQYPLQRSGSARLNRPAATVDKNKPRGAPTRPANHNGTATLPVSAGGPNQNQSQNQNQNQPPPELVPDLVNANGPVTPVLPVPTSDNSNTGSGTTGTSSLGFRARTGSRSSPKTAAGSRLQNATGLGSKPGIAEPGGGCLTVGGTKQNHSKEQAEKKNQGINQLRRLLVQGNKRVEALAIVIQQLFSEREEVLKQKKELSLDLVNLRDELVSSSKCCERLQKEKEEVHLNLEEAVRKLEEQHKEELEQLEDRLRSFYQTEWDKVHQMYQEEADRCRTLMEQQVEELRSRQETERKNQEVSHSQKMECLKQQCETSIQELKRCQQIDLENQDRTLKEMEASLSEKIAELTSEKDALNEKLRAEEERRRILSDKNLKDSHTVYLEQELESLKVVLEIKNSQLHQKEKKLMEMDKLVESNVKLEECLKKVQQENEDYKARMDKHAALSKQLSSEQAMLQQTLQKESKVNKRLSMENEELLWKLHNGDLLASPRRLSPTSPFHSPRNSASFPATTSLSPR
ncbi:uncharacterized protein ACJ7VT_018728 isoform 1-T2 [Polymixia lowei]